MCAKKRPGCEVHIKQALNYSGNPLITPPTEAVLDGELPQ